MAAKFLKKFIPWIFLYVHYANTYFETLNGNKDDLQLSTFSSKVKYRGNLKKYKDIHFLSFPSYVVINEAITKASYFRIPKETQSKYQNHDKVKTFRLGTVRLINLDKTEIHVQNRYVIFIFT